MAQTRNWYGPRECACCGGGPGEISCCNDTIDSTYTDDFEDGILDARLIPDSNTTLTIVTAGPTGEALNMDATTRSLGVSTDIHCSAKGAIPLKIYGEFDLAEIKITPAGTTFWGYHQGIQLPFPINELSGQLIPRAWFVKTSLIQGVVFGPNVQSYWSLPGGGNNTYFTHTHAAGDTLKLEGVWTEADFDENLCQVGGTITYTCYLNGSNKGSFNMTYYKGPLTSVCDRPFEYAAFHGTYASVDDFKFDNIDCGFSA